MIRKAMPLLVLALVAGCSSRDGDLERFIAQTKQEEPSGVEPLPDIRQHESFTYQAQHLRSPFVPGGSGDNSTSACPKGNRNREHLEQFTLDTLTMVGTLQISGRNYALVRSRDGVVHRVLPGNYLGQSEGRIVSIEPTKITLTEIVTDQIGGCMERPATLNLAE
jgi:type IV pilus assembly protein PilP